jgi:general stress protein 26
VQETEFDGDLWFFAYDDSDKARQIEVNPKVNVSFANDQKSEWTSIAGTAEIVHDRAKAEELWAKPLETWFPDGLETQGLALIKVHAETAEYWDAADSKVKQLLGIDFHETTRDGSVTLEPVYCLGLCACSPSAMLDGEVIGRLDDEKIEEIVAEVRS